MRSAWHIQATSRAATLGPEARGAVVGAKTWPGRAEPTTALRLARAPGVSSFAGPHAWPGTAEHATQEQASWQSWKCHAGASFVMPTLALPMPLKKRGNFSQSVPSLRRHCRPQIVRVGHSLVNVQLRHNT